MRHFNIPFFIPEQGCPHQCVFCDQRRISGIWDMPSPCVVGPQVESYLSTLPTEKRHVEIAFFGGNFTGLEVSLQESFLAAAAPWLDQGLVQGIRLSTRPDYINRDILNLLKKYGVTSIELGAQSLDDGVLGISGRGHTAAHVESASKMIRAAGFRLGLQMMIGLPGDNLEKSLFTARRIVDLGVSETRIYPTLVIKGTLLADMYNAGTYKPLELGEAVEGCKQLLLFFENKGVRVLRMGLHPSKGLIKGSDLLGGPFHPALKELVTTAIWKDIFIAFFHQLDHQQEEESLFIRVSPGELSSAIGHQATNRKWLQQFFKKVVIKADSELKGREFHVDHC